jgi:hypothetical protein
MYNFVEPVPMKELPIKSGQSGKDPSAVEYLCHTPCSRDAETGVSVEYCGCVFQVVSVGSGTGEGSGVIVGVNVSDSTDGVFCGCVAFEPQAEIRNIATNNLERANA